MISLGCGTGWSISQDYPIPTVLPPVQHITIHVSFFSDAMMILWQKLLMGERALLDSKSITMGKWRQKELKTVGHMISAVRGQQPMKTASAQLHFFNDTVPDLAREWCHWQWVGLSISINTIKISSSRPISQGIRRSVRLTINRNTRP